MARLYSTDIIESPNKKRPGVHAKSKSSGLKSSKNYKKKYRGQGR
jgi:hypothetical protein